jgi:hypothetical protein
MSVASMTAADDATRRLTINAVTGCKQRTDYIMHALHRRVLHRAHQQN